MHLRKSGLLLTLFFTCFISFQNDSDARRRGKGIVFINFANETISERKDLTVQDLLFVSGMPLDTPGVEGQPLPAELSGLKIGYKYTYCGLFWLELWTWGGEVVLYHPGEKAYEPIPSVTQEKLAAKYGKPFFYKFPPLLIGGILFGAFWFFGVMSQGKSQAEKNYMSSGGAGGMPVPEPAGGGGAPAAPAPPAYSTEQLQQMYEDPRYQHALELLEQTNSFIQPVEYLVQNGVPEAEAGASLAALKKAIAESQEG